MGGLIFMICLLFILAAVGFGFAWLVHKISKPKLGEIASSEPVVLRESVLEKVRQHKS